MELVDFLRARLDEDEALAREAPEGPWHIGNAVDPTQPCGVYTFPGARLVADGLNWLVAEHIARQHPARVLAEVEAKREVVRLAERAHDYHETFVNGFAAALEGALRLFARAYRAHPDFDPAWLDD